MAKQNVTEKVSSSSVESHGFLHGLINAIQHLVVMISSRLRHTQINQSPMGETKGDYDIWKRLGSHMEQMSAQGQQATESQAIGNRTGVEPDRSKNPATRVSEFNGRVSELHETVREASELSEHGKKKSVDKLQPRMNQQLQSKTMEHINIALILAAEGNEDGARLHIGLAESAMQTASRFMSHEEYEVFEQRVEQRLESIIDQNVPDDSAT